MMKNLKFILIVILIFYKYQKVEAQTCDSTVLYLVDSMIQLCWKLEDKAEFDNAIAAINEAEKITLKYCKENSKEYGDCCHHKAHIFKSAGNNQDAIKWYQEAVRIRESVYGKMHADVALSLHNLGNAYASLQDIKNAEMNLLEGLRRFEGSVGKEHKNYAVNLYSLANLYYSIDQYEKALLYGNQCLQIREKTLGKENVKYLQTLSLLGEMYSKTGDYFVAEKLFLECADIRAHVFGKRSQDYLKSMMNLAQFYSLSEANEKSKKYFLQCQDFFNETKDSTSDNYLLFLNNYSLLSKKLGDWSQAEKMTLECVNIASQVKSKVDPDFARFVLNLGNLYQELGVHQKALGYTLEAKNLYEQIYGKYHPAYADCLNSLANVYAGLKKYNEAELLQLEGLTISEKTVGRDHPNYGLNLMNLGNLYIIKKEFLSAEKNLIESNLIWKKYFGPNHFYYAAGLLNLSGVYIEMEKFDEAEKIIIQCKDIFENAVGKENNHYAGVLYTLSNLYFSKNNQIISEDYLTQAAQYEKSKILKSASFLAEEELEQHIQNYFSGVALPRLFSIVEGNFGKNDSFTLSNSILPGLCYDNALFLKGFLQNAAVRLRFLGKSNITNQNVFSRYVQSKNNLAAELSKPIIDRTNVEKLEEQVVTDEKECVRIISGFGSAIEQVNWRQIQANLKNNEAAIEFVHFEKTYPIQTDSILYGALICKPGFSQPEFIPLFEQKEMFSSSETLIQTQTLYNNEPNKKFKSYVNLYSLIWQKIDPFIQGIKTIYYSPTGVLHKINLDAIQYPDKTIVAERFKLIRLNSTRQCIQDDYIIEKNQFANLFGGIYYDINPSIVNSNGAKDLKIANIRGEDFFNVIDSSYKNVTWKYLSGTETEVTAINKIFKRNGLISTVYKGFAGSEDSIKSNGREGKLSPRILHIATHGYFFPEKEIDPMSSSYENLAFKTNKDPLFRSGLICAGANHYWKTGKLINNWEHDGILTAYEIQQLNLSNTELVVLSACETGLGDIKGNEGVYGLQRAFKIAGAKNLIMSLWKVPDAETREFMIKFYQNWLDEKMTLSDAFRKTQKEMREIYVDPYFWAGFVLIE